MEVKFEFGDVVSYCSDTLLTVKGQCIPKGCRGVVINDHGWCKFGGRQWQTLDIEFCDSTTPVLVTGLSAMNVQLLYKAKDRLNYNDLVMVDGYAKCKWHKCAPIYGKVVRVDPCYKTVLVKFTDKYSSSYDVTLNYDAVEKIPAAPSEEEPEKQNTPWVVFNENYEIVSKHCFLSEAYAAATSFAEANIGTKCHIFKHDSSFEAEAVKPKIKITQVSGT